MIFVGELFMVLKLKGKFKKFVSTLSTVNTLKIYDLVTKNKKNWKIQCLSKNV